MKKIYHLSIFSLLISSMACAQAPVFTTLATSGKNVFAGVKLEKKGMEPETYMLEVEADKLSSKKVSLPTELIHREIVSIFPAQNNMIVVMTQRTVEQGDRPLFHSFNPLKGEWKKLAELDCVSFAKLKVEQSSIAVSCVETDEKGEEKENPKKVVFKDIKFSRPQDITLPITKLQTEPLKAELLGEEFEWKELKVGYDKKEKIFRP